MSFVDQLFSLHGKVALVGGASRGIGRALAAGLSKAGATVVATGRSSAPEPQFPSPSAVAGEVGYQRCDLLDSPAFRDLCDQIVARHGRLDVYVHAAGVSLAPDEPDSAFPNFRRTIEANLITAHACCRAASACMDRERGGSIIPITSINAYLAFPNNPGYVASKAGLSGLTRAMALDLGSKNIRVNSIAPGYVRTAMTEQTFRDPDKNAERVGRMILPRWGTPEDLVGAAIFLASDASAYVTGQDLVVDGGWTAKGL